MSNVTSINLGDHFTTFLKKMTASGRYGSASEAIRAALRLLEQEESKYASLLNGLIEGEESGESTSTFDELVGQAKAQIHAQ